MLPHIRSRYKNTEEKRRVRENRQLAKGPLFWHYMALDQQTHWGSSSWGLKLSLHYQSPSAYTNSFFISFCHEKQKKFGQLEIRSGHGRKWKWRKREKKTDTKQVAREKLRRELSAVQRCLLHIFFNTLLCNISFGEMGTAERFKSFSLLLLLGSHLYERQINGSASWTLILPLVPIWDRLLAGGFGERAVMMCYWGLWLLL